MGRRERGGYLSLKRSDPPPTRPPRTLPPHTPFPPVPPLPPRPQPLGPWGARYCPSQQRGVPSPPPPRTLSAPHPSHCPTWLRCSSKPVESGRFGTPRRGPASARTRLGLWSLRGPAPSLAGGLEPLLQLSCLGGGCGVGTPRPSPRRSGSGSSQQGCLGCPSPQQGTGSWEWRGRGRGPLPAKVPACAAGQDRRPCRHPRTPFHLAPGQLPPAEERLELDHLILF